MIIHELTSLIKIISKQSRKARDFFLDLIFPVECLECGREGGWLCADCFRGVKLKAGQFCLHCKKENDFGEFCPNCKGHYALAGVWIAFVYEEEIITRLIKYLKYHFIKEIAVLLADYLRLLVNNLLNHSRIIRGDLIFGLDRRKLEGLKTIPRALLDFNQCLIMPVPLSSKRYRWRGFNQAQNLARHFSGYFNLEINTRDLIRIKHKKPQAKLNESQRRENIKACFDWRGGDLGNRHVILIDDVVTTGSTLNECAEVLKANGAGEVWGLVVSKG